MVFRQSRKNLKNTMTYTGSKKTSLSCRDVCDIIKVSAKAGVYKLKFKDLHIEFGRPTEGVNSPVQQNIAINPVVDLTGEQHYQQTKNAVEADEVSLREEQLARLLVEDPVKYEELLRDGELSDDMDSSDGEDAE